MQCIFLRRGYPDTTPSVVVVNITGSGDTTYSGTVAQVTIDGTAYTSATSVELAPESTIILSVRGRSSSYKGTVTIDGEVVFENSSTWIDDYTWTIPSGAAQTHCLLQRIS